MFCFQSFKDEHLDSHMFEKNVENQAADLIQHSSISLHNIDEIYALVCKKYQ